MLAMTTKLMHRKGAPRNFLVFLPIIEKSGQKHALTVHHSLLISFLILYITNSPTPPPPFGGVSLDRIQGNRCCTQRVASNQRWCDCINLFFWKKVLESFQCTSTNLQKNKSINSFSYGTEKCSKVGSYTKPPLSSPLILLKLNLNVS